MTYCPICGTDLCALLWLEVYGELRAGKMTEGAYIPVDVICPACSTEHHVMMEVQLELISLTFDKSIVHRAPEA